MAPKHCLCPEVCTGESAMWPTWSECLDMRQNLGCNLGENFQQMTRLYQAHESLSCRGWGEKVGREGVI